MGHVIACKDDPNIHALEINLATYPHWGYLIVSLENEPVVRVWRIADGKVEEEALEVVE